MMHANARGRRQGSARRVVISRHTRRAALLRRLARPLLRARPRLTMVKLTPELIETVSSQLNPVKERQLDLRGAPFFGAQTYARVEHACRLHHSCDRKSWYHQGAFRTLSGYF